MPDIDSALAHYTEAHRSAGAPEWPSPADDADLDELQHTVAPLLVPEQLLALWRRSSEGPAWLVDAGDLVGPRTSLEMWQELNAPGSRPFAPTLLPVALAGHVYLAVELAYPAETSGGAVLRVPFEQIEPVAPDLATALDFAASAIEEGNVRWTGRWWEGADIEQAQRAMAAASSWPPHLASIGSVIASQPLTWPPPWQRSAGLDPADAEPRGATATIGAAEQAPAGSTLRAIGHVQGLVGSEAGTHPTLVDDTGSIPCWCSTASDPFAVVRKGDVIEVDLVIQDADPVPTGGEAIRTLAAAPAGRFVANRVRPAAVE